MAASDEASEAGSLSRGWDWETCKVRGKVWTPLRLKGIGGLNPCRIPKTFFAIEKIHSCIKIYKTEIDLHC